MANPSDRHPANADGPWFVDRSCINCDVSRQCAPWMFGETDDQAVVVRQPATPEETRDAVRAMLACPTASIGVIGRKPPTDGLFPEPLEDGVHYCGFTSRPTSKPFPCRGTRRGVSSSCCEVGPSSRAILSATAPGAGG